MKRSFIYISLVAMTLAACLSSCEKVIEFTGDETAPYVVMVSNPKCDSIWNVRLTYSRFFLASGAIKTISDADFKLKVNGQDLSSNVTFKDNGIFDLGYVPQCGDSLQLQVTVPGKDPINAACRIPNRPTIEDIHFDFDTNDRYTSDGVEYFSGEVTVNFTINDNAAERNYYMVQVFQLYEDYDGTLSWSPYNIYIDDNVLFEENPSDDLFDMGVEENNGTKIVFSDERINGKRHNINFKVYYYSGGEAYYRPQYKVLVSQIDHNLYLYQKTLRVAENQDEFSSILAEPAQIYTNVAGGIGILGGMASTEFYIQDILK